MDVFLLVEYRRLSLMSDLTLRPTGGDGGIGGLGDVTVYCYCCNITFTWRH